MKVKVRRMNETTPFCSCSSFASNSVFLINNAWHVQQVVPIPTRCTLKWVTVFQESSFPKRRQNHTFEKWSGNVKWGTPLKNIEKTWNRLRRTIFTLFSHSLKSEIYMVALINSLYVSAVFISLWNLKYISIFLGEYITHRLNICRGINKEFQTTPLVTIPAWLFSFSVNYLSRNKSIDI